MNKKKVEGNDKIGKLIRCNNHTLKPCRKGYAEVVFWGDVHYGHPQCDIKKAMAMLNYCMEHGIYVIGMGDMLECGTRLSIGDSVYKQNLNPQEQMEEMLEFLKPIAESGLLLGLHSGNHEDRISNMSSLNITKNMCRELNVPYLGGAMWHKLKVGKQNYSLYTMHGAGGAQFVHTKLGRAVQIANNFWCDVFAMGHVHAKACEPIERQRLNLRNKIVEQFKMYIVLTGSWLTYDRSYAQTSGYGPATIGSPKVKLYAETRKIHGST
jgi:UDP-2,3-diacylglucosamine pyrophosphatase LpxH